MSVNRAWVIATGITRRSPPVLTVGKEIAEVSMALDERRFAVLQRPFIGPVFDLDGRQIGVASLGETDTQGIGYAISIGQVEKVLSDLKAGTKQAGLGACPAA